MQKTLKVIVVSILLVCATTVYAKKQSVTKAAVKKTVIICINQFIPHPSLNAVLWGFKEYLAESGIAVKYKEYDAKGKMEIAGQIAAQIAVDKPALVLALGTPSAQACAKAAGTTPQLAHTPLLFSAISDPFAAGLVKGPAHPGTNVTGVSDQMSMDKNLDMIRSFQPGLKKLGVLYSPVEKNSVTTMKRLQEAAAKRNITLIDAPVAGSADVAKVAESLVGKVDAIYVPTDNTVIAAIDAVVKVCERARLPLFSADIDSVKKGVIAALGFDYFRHGRQTARMAKKILTGTKAETLPVEFQSDLFLAVNPQAAERMGLVIDKAILKSADKVY